MNPKSFPRGGFASNLKVDSWRMIDICTCVGVPQRSSDFFAALYQLFFSLKMEQMFSTFCGGAVAQPTPATTHSAPISWEVRRERLALNLREFLGNPCMYMNVIVKLLAQGL
jgi:hypothetical protein